MFLTVSGKEIAVILEQPWKAYAPIVLRPDAIFKVLDTWKLSPSDAVYVGGKCFSLRAFSNNFTNEELKEAVIYTHNLLNYTTTDSL